MKKSKTAVEVVLIDFETLEDNLAEECACLDVFELVPLVELLLVLLDDLDLVSLDELDLVPLDDLERVLLDDLERVLLVLATTFSSMVLKTLEMKS